MHLVESEIMNCQLFHFDCMHVAVLEKACKAWTFLNKDVFESLITMISTPGVLSDDAGFHNTVCGVYDMFNADTSHSMINFDCVAIIRITLVYKMCKLSRPIIVCRR